MIVAKLGGSLFDHPALRVGLNRWLDEQPRPVLIVPGGGDLADGVRAFDHRHRVGEAVAHRAALRTLTATAELVRSMVSRPGVEVLDAFAFCRDEDATLPQAWTVTTDSIALRAAVVRRAEKLVLLKSADRPAGSWAVAAGVGFVDEYFPTIADGAGVPIEVVNFRRRLDAV